MCLSLLPLPWDGVAAAGGVQDLVQNVIHETDRERRHRPQPSALYHVCRRGPPPTAMLFVLSCGGFLKPT